MQNVSKFLSTTLTEKHQLDDDDRAVRWEQLEGPLSRKGKLTHQVSECGFVMSHKVVYDCSPAEIERCGQLEVILPCQWQ